MGMGGSDGCRNDILLIAWEYVIYGGRFKGDFEPQTGPR